MQAGWTLLALRLPRESPALTKVYSREVGDPPAQDKEIGGRGGDFSPLCLPGASSAGRSQDMWGRCVIYVGCKGARGRHPHPHPVSRSLSGHVHILAAGWPWGLGQTWSSIDDDLIPPLCFSFLPACSVHARLLHIPSPNHPPPEHTPTLYTIPQLTNYLVTCSWLGLYPSMCQCVHSQPEQQTGFSS